MCGNDCHRFIAAVVDALCLSIYFLSFLLCCVVRIIDHWLCHPHSTKQPTAIERRFNRARYKRDLSQRNSDDRRRPVIQLCPNIRVHPSGTKKIKADDTRQAIFCPIPAAIAATRRRWPLEGGKSAKKSCGHK